MKANFDTGQMVKVTLRKYNEGEQEINSFLAIVKDVAHDEREEFEWSPSYLLWSPSTGQTLIASHMQIEDIECHVNEVKRYTKNI